MAKRKKASKICCVLMILLLTAITLFQSFTKLLGVDILLVLILSLLLTTLTSFTGITLVETYPHTVRNLAYCLFTSF